MYYIMIHFCYLLLSGLTMINFENIISSSQEWINSDPFPYFVVENFFNEDLALKLEDEFPDFNDDVWHEYGNAIEVKKVCNNYNAFPELTYRVFSYLNSDSFVSALSNCLFDESKLIPDYGLNGGGWHIHSQGGKLNTHLDYSLHPKTKLQRKINIIVYLNSDWKPNWGGNLGLWGNERSDMPGDLKKEIAPLFNRAVIFDTTMNSWHGLPQPLKCPKDQFRKSLAIYYLTEPSPDVSDRGKAFFAPTAEQKDDPEVLNLIKNRSSISTASSVYKNK